MHKLAKLTLLALPGACAAPGAVSQPWRQNEPLALQPLVETAAAQGTILELPAFERTPDEVRSTAARVMAEADARLADFVAQDPAAVSFASSIAALDDLLYPVGTALNRFHLMAETRPEPELREACNAEVQRVQEWLVALQIREDVYQVCRAYAYALAAGARPPLDGEDRLLFEDAMRDFRRAGFHLDAAARAAVAEKLKQLSRMITEFDRNINQAEHTLWWTAEELDGVPDSFLEASRGPDGRHAVRAHVTPDYITVVDNARNPQVRRALTEARFSLAMAENGPLLNQIVALRDEIAQDLEYASWADYQIEVKMAGNGTRALEFVRELVAGLEPKFRAEVEELRQLKVAETGDPYAELPWSDYRYYQNQLMKQRYELDQEALRIYFELNRVLEGMFDVYEQIFGLQIRAVTPPDKWVEDLRLYAILDAAGGRPLGLLYLDLFPRPGKYNHFAQFDVAGGKRMADGRYRRPVAALVCNFTPGVGDQPALMSHEEVETLFHEFGHALHTILTQVRYGRYAGANVPRDFVEAPSQMLENWVWDRDVLRRFAVDWRDPSAVIPASVIRNLRRADLATKGVYYRRQCALALADLRLHLGDVDDAGRECDEAHAEVFFAPPAGTNFAAYWGHLSGYDAGYYGYAWADAIAADLATVFEDAPGGYLDSGAGLRLRREIYEVGGSRDANESVRAFLGRDTNQEAFLESLGVR